MSSFTEQATLRVVDQSSRQISKINAELKQLFATAEKLRSRKIDLGLDTSKLTKAQAELRKLAAAVNALHGAASRVTLTVNTASLTAAQRQLQQLRNAAANPIPAATPRHRRDLLVDEAGNPIPSRSRRTRAMAGAVGSGLAQGFGLPIGGLSGGFVAVELAAYAAAQALKAVTESAATRDRTKLQSQVAATEAQRKKFDELDRISRKGPAEAFPFTKDQRDRLRTSLLGDVGGETEGERAVAAESITKFLERDLYPRIFAQDPSKTPEQAQEGLRKIVQAVNLASADITDRFGNMTEDGKRVFRGIQLAQAADPELSAGLIKSTMANLKTAGFALSEQAIATTLMAAGNQGVRAGNETFRAIKALAGTTDVKVLNNALAKMGLLLDVQRNAKGNVIAGSGTPIDQTMLQTNPMEYLHKYIAPIMEKDLKAQAEKRAAKAKTPEDKARLSEVTQDDRIAWINRSFAGMNAAAQNGIAQMMLTYDQNGRQLRQAQAGLSQDAKAAISKSWAAQWEVLKNALEDRRAEVGDAAFESMGLAEKLKLVTAAVRDPMGAEGQQLAGGAAKTLATALNPLLLGSQLLVAGGKLWMTVGNAILNKLGIKTEAKTPEQEAKDTAARQNEAEQSQTKQQIAKLQREREIALLSARSDPTLANITKSNDRVRALDERIRSLEDQLRLQQSREKLIQERGTAEPQPQDFPVWVRQAIVAATKPPKTPPPPKVKTVWEDTEQARESNRKAADAARRDAAKRQPVPKAGRNAWGDPSKSTPVDDIKESVDQFNASTAKFGSWMQDYVKATDTAQTAAGTYTAFGKTMTLSSSSFAASVAMIPGAATAFQTVFSTGTSDAKTAIAGAGTTAGTNAISTISGGSEAAGVVYGNSALSIIRNGVANLNLNVHATVDGPKPNTGPQKPD